MALNSGRGHSWAVEATGDEDGLMNGIIPIEIRKFIEFRLGPLAWPEVVAAAGIPFRVYVPVTNYPDDEIVALLAAFAQRTGETVPTLLVALGEFIAPELLAMVPTLIRPHWKTLDLIENTEQAIHEVSITEPCCMLRGDTACRLHVTLTSD